MRAVGWFLVMALAGCWGRGEHEGGWGRGGFPALDLAATLPADGGATPSLVDGGGDALGSGRTQPATSAPLHVLANASISIPAGQVGFAVTANGRGGYRVAWIDTAGADRRYHGSAFVAGSFSQVAPVGMQYAIADGGRLDFQSAPGGGTSGYVDFVSSVDPIVVDALDGGSDGTLYYVDAGGATRSVTTPATFTSP